MSAFWDFLPTAAELAGLEAPEGIDGISYLPTLLGLSGQRTHEYLYWEFHEQGGKQAVRLGDWKGVRLRVGEKPDGPIELYNLKADVGESKELSGQNPEITGRIRTIMQSARSESALWTFGRER